MVIVQHRRADRFFTAQQQRRLEELMINWRAARDSGSALSDQDQQELESLVEVEVQAADRRAKAIAHQFGP